MNTPEHVAEPVEAPLLEHAQHAPVGPLPVTLAEEDESRPGAFDADLTLWIMASSTCGGLDPDTGCLSTGC